MLDTDSIASIAVIMMPRQLLGNRWEQPRDQAAQHALVMRM